MVFLSFSVYDFIGRFHPVLVHLPVGILLLAALFIALSTSEKFQSLKSAISISLLFGMLSAIASCISGFLLSKTDSYDESLLFKHQWFAIALAITSVIVYVLHLTNKPTKLIAVLMVVLITITGHLGGSITHGSDFLTKAFSSGTNPSGDGSGKTIVNVQEALAFTTVIKPILDSKCIACHGPTKQKGKLRLDEPSFIKQGGEGGMITLTAKGSESELLKRILLPKENKDHMPPQEKPQLSKEDVALLQWWIENGSGFDQKVKDIEQNEKIKTVLKGLESAKPKDEPLLSDIPDQIVSMGDEKAMKMLRERGVAVSAVAQKSNYLTANFVAVESFSGKDLQLLEPLKKQLIWLKLGNMPLTDEDLKTVGKLASLVKLNLQKTKITDQGISQLKNLSELQYLNLAGTSVTTKGLEALSGLKKLHKLFLFQTSITEADISGLKNIFSNATIDIGGYKVPMLQSDTVILKAPVIK